MKCHRDDNEQKAPKKKAAEPTVYYIVQHDCGTSNASSATGRAAFNGMLLPVGLQAFSSHSKIADATWIYIPQSFHCWRYFGTWLALCNIIDFEKPHFHRIVVLSIYK